MESKFSRSISFHKAAPILSSIMLIATAIGLDSPYSLVKLLCGVVSAASFVAFIASAKGRTI